MLYGCVATTTPPPPERLKYGVRSVNDILKKFFYELSNFMDIHSSDPTLPFNVGFYNLL